MTANGGTTTKPFDLDAAGAAAREAAGEGFQFTYRKKKYTCLPAKLWPLTTASALSKGDLQGALLDILGPDQGEKFLEAKPSMAEVETLMTALAEFSGVGSLGE